MQQPNRFIRLVGQIASPPVFGRLVTTHVPRAVLSVRTTNFEFGRDGIPTAKLVEISIDGEAAELCPRNLWVGDVVSIEGEGYIDFWLSEEDREDAECQVGAEVYDGAITISQVHRIARQEAKHFPGFWPRFKI